MMKLATVALLAMAIGLAAAEVCVCVIGPLQLYLDIVYTFLPGCTRMGWTRLAPCPIQ